MTQYELFLLMQNGTLYCMTTRSGVKPERDYKPKEYRDKRKAVTAMQSIDRTFIEQNFPGEQDVSVYIVQKDLDEDGYITREHVLMARKV